MGFGNTHFTSKDEFMATRIHPLEDGFYTLETQINGNVVNRQYFTPDEFELLKFEVNAVDGRVPSEVA